MEEGFLMGRSTTRIQKLTRVTTLDDGDVFPTGPVSGDRAKGITFENLKATIELTDESIVEASTDYTLLGTEDTIELTGTGNLTMLDTSVAVRSVVVYAATGTITLVLQGSDTTNQATITVGNSARYTPFTGEWIAT